MIDKAILEETVEFPPEKRLLPSQMAKDTEKQVHIHDSKKGEK